MPRYNRFSNRVKWWVTQTVFNNNWIKVYSQVSLDLEEQEEPTSSIKRRRAMFKTRNKRKYNYNNGSFRCSNNYFYSKYSGLREARQWSFNKISGSPKLIHNHSSTSQFYRSPNIITLSKKCSLKRLSIIIRSLCFSPLKMNLFNLSTPKYMILTNITSNWEMLYSKLKFNYLEYTQL